LANVNGVKNAVVVDCDAVGQTLYYGAGAGSEPTASAVLADVIDIARNVRGDQSRRVPYLSYHSHAIADQVILPIEAIQSSYYLRVSVLDRPGVLSAVASILSDAGISIEAIIQKAPRPDEDVVPVIILTNSALEQSLADAVFRLQSLDSVVGAITRIRVENLDD
jgi:homoserine dehydrogenase